MKFLIIAAILVMATFAPAMMISGLIYFLNRWQFSCRIVSEQELKEEKIPGPTAGEIR